MNHSPLLYSLSFISGMPGGGEVVLLFMVILVLFGPRKLPEIARMIGRTINQLRKASHEFTDQVMMIGDDVKDEITNAAKDAVDLPGDSEVDEIDRGDELD